MVSLEVAHFAEAYKNPIVAISEHQSLPHSQWHLFNDFLVRRLPTESALHLSPTWKMPVILTYQDSSARHAIDNHWKEQLDTSCLYYGWSMKCVSFSQFLFI